MATVKLYPKVLNTSESSRNPLPQLLQTPSGLALLEMQGTINLPSSEETESDHAPSAHDIPIGRLIFPAYNESNKEDKSWMKQVYMYVGKHQRLTGEVKRLPKAIAIIRKRVDAQEDKAVDEDGDMDGERQEKVEELEIVEIVKYKIIFSTRPEPVGTTRPEPAEARRAGDEV